MSLFAKKPQTPPATPPTTGAPPPGLRGAPPPPTKTIAKAPPKPTPPAAPTKTPPTKTPPTGSTPPAPPPVEEHRSRADEEKQQKYDQLKNTMHRKLVEQLDMNKLERDASGETREKVRQVVLALFDEEAPMLTSVERQRLAVEILHETFGLGPLERLLADPDISDILINGPQQVYIERKGKLTLSEVKFKDNAHLLHIIDKIVSPLGRRCDETTPMVDARLKDGSRVNAIIPPLAIDGASMSIRRFGKDPIKWEDYVRFKSCAPEMVDFLRACVISGLNILIVGGTGSGKTTLLNNMSSFIPEAERVVTIEDAAELQLRQPHVVRLETRPANIEGKGRITIRDLIINALRMRPDRIVVGECRGGETLDMLQAMNTGHDGSMTTIHANTTRDAVQRVETMVMMSGFDLPTKAIRQQFAGAINLIVMAARLTGGPRKIINITEVQGMEGEVITMQDIFKFEQDGVTAEGRAHGRLVSTGVRPGFLDRLKSSGCTIDTEVFKPRDLMSDME